MGLFFLKKLNSEQLQKKIAAFNKRTEELQALREELKGQQADGLAREATGEQALELPRILKQLGQVIVDLEGRDLALDRLNIELAEVQRREQLAEFAAEKEQAELWLKSRAEDGMRLAQAIAALGKAIKDAQNDGIPPAAALRGLKYGYSGALSEREMLFDAVKFEPALFSLAEGIKVFGGIDGGDSLGKKHVMVNSQLLKEAATSAEQNGVRLRELVEKLMARHEAGIVEG